MRIAFFILITCLTARLQAQDDLIKKLENNKSAVSSKWQFKEVINIENTSVKNQASSGTCWSYGTNSFLESEMIKAGRKPVDLAEIYCARRAYEEKADNYVRMHGAVSWGDGGEPHDVINMYRKYGAIPQEVYTGLQYGTKTNKFGEMQAIIEAMLKAVVTNPNGQLTPSWKKALNGVLDAYLGVVPATFSWEGHTYTPQSFAEKVVGLNANDYIEFMATTFQPINEKGMFMVPDNWAFEHAYNIKMEQLTVIIDNALKSGYTVAWATDVSEKFFSWKTGVAFVPEKEWFEMSAIEQSSLFNEPPAKERVITEEIREAAIDNYNTTDDHTMHIVGMATDATGREYYIVKNSWGASNDYKGYLYASKNFILYKTTGIMLNKKGVPASIISQLK